MSLYQSAAVLFRQDSQGAQNVSPWKREISAYNGEEVRHQTLAQRTNSTSRRSQVWLRDVDSTAIQHTPVSQQACTVVSTVCTQRNKHERKQQRGQMLLRLQSRSHSSDLGNVQTQGLLFPGLETRPVWRKWRIFKMLSSQTINWY